MCVCVCVRLSTHVCVCVCVRLSRHVCVCVCVCMRGWGNVEESDKCAAIKTY